MEKNWHKTGNTRPAKLGKCSDWNISEVKRLVGNRWYRHDRVKGAAPKTPSHKGGGKGLSLCVIGLMEEKSLGANSLTVSHPAVSRNSHQQQPTISSFGEPQEISAGTGQKATANGGWIWPLIPQAALRYKSTFHSIGFYNGQHCLGSETAVRKNSGLLVHLKIQVRAQKPKVQASYQQNQEMLLTSWLTSSLCVGLMFLFPLGLEG